MKLCLLLVCVCVLSAGCASKPDRRQSRSARIDLSPLKDPSFPDGDPSAPRAHWTWEGRTEEELRRTFGEPGNIVPHEGQTVWFFSKESTVMVNFASEADMEMGLIACGAALQAEEWRFFLKKGKVTGFVAARYVNGRKIPFEKW